MKLVRMWSLLQMLPVLAGMAWVTSCRDASEEARQVVLESGYRFTIQDFLKAAGEGRGGVVSRFLAAGMRVDAADERGRTGLVVAAAAGQAHLVRQLLAAGAAVDQADRDGVTALIAAAGAGDGVAVQALRAAGAQADRVDAGGRNALAAAAAAGHAGVVDLLVPETGGSLEEVLRLACAAGHTGVMDGLMKSDRAGKTLEWSALLDVAARGGHLPAVRLLNSRMPFSTESGRIRLGAAQVARSAGQAGVAAFLEEEGGHVPEPPEMATLTDPLQPGPPAVDGAPGEGLPVELPASEPVSMVPAAAPRRLGGARFPLVQGEAMAQIPEVLKMTAWEPQVWPVILQDVAPEHGSAEIVLTGETSRTVTLKVGDEIPGTDCVVEKLRRRRLYTDATESELKNVSELHFRRAGTDEVFLAMAGEAVLSNQSSARLLISGGARQWAAVPGDEFRLGSLLLRVARIASGAITLENRLTRETVTVPLTKLP